MPPNLTRSVLTAEHSLRGLTLCSASSSRTAPPTTTSLTLLRHASAKRKETAMQQAKLKKRKKEKVQYKRDPLERGIFFPLCDAMRYIRAFEAGQSPVTTKYDLAINLKTNRNSPVVRNGIRLPHPVDVTQRIAVICPPGSKAAQDALAAGASVVGEEEIFDAVKAGVTEFERCLCHTDSYDKLTKAGIARILGPKGLMPNVKTGTVLKEVGLGVESLRGGLQFRERSGVIRLPIGRLNHSPEQLMANVQAVMAIVKRDVAKLNEQAPKAVHDVVLSAPRSPGFPLSGAFMGPDSLEPQQMAEAA